MNALRYHFDLECPRCGTTSNALHGEPECRVRCEKCFMAGEIVTMTVTKITDEERFDFRIGMSHAEARRADWEKWGDR